MTRPHEHGFPCHAFVTRDAELIHHATTHRGWQDDGRGGQLELSASKMCGSALSFLRGGGR
jgi:hypothetical protein